MSNVLIGIIGVILFIGLAIAGALFLGPRFQESSYNAEAARVINSVRQVSSAAAMYQTDMSGPIPIGTDLSALTSKGYLRTVPGNPYDTSWTVEALDNGFARDGGANVFAWSIGNRSGVCEAIQRQTAQTQAGFAFDDTVHPLSDMLKAGGCFKVAQSIGGAPANSYVAFASF